MSKKKTARINNINETSFFYRQRYFLFFFAFFIVYQFTVVNHCRIVPTNGLTYTYHLLDFSFGFCARFLPGAVYNFISGGDAAVWKVTAWDLFLTLSLFVFVSYALSRFVLSFEEKEIRQRMFALCLFFVSGAFTFAGFTLTLGVHDLNWLLLSAVFVFALQRKYFRPALPVLAVLSALIHYSTLVSYLFLFALLLLFETASKQDKKEKRVCALLFFVTVFSCAAVSLYLIATEKNNLVYDIEAFDRELNLRSRSGEDAVDDNYFRFALYGDLECYEMIRAVVPRIHPLIGEGSALPAPVVEVLNKAWQQISIHIETLKTYPHFYEQLFAELLLLAPALGFFLRFWIDMIRRAAARKNRIEVFVFVCAIVQFPLMIVIWHFMSWDKVRYVTNAFLIQFTLALYVMYHRREDAAELIRKYLTKKNAAFAALYYLVYASTALYLYS